MINRFVWNDLILDDEITTEEIINAFGRAKNGNSPRVDGISIEFYKNVPFLIDQLSNKFIIIFTKGEIPYD